jgi:hypothetical protein
MCMDRVVWGSLKCVQPSHFCQRPVPQKLRLLLGSWKDVKSPGVNQISAELIQKGGETLRSEIHKLIKLTWNTEELPHQWKKSVVRIHKKGDKTDCNNYRGVSLLSTSYKILSYILLSRLTPDADEIIGDHQCGIRRNRSMTNQIFYIRQTLERK